MPSHAQLSRNDITEIADLIENLGQLTGINNSNKCRLEKQKNGKHLSSILKNRKARKQKIPGMERIISKTLGLRSVESIIQNNNTNTI